MSNTNNFTAAGKLYSLPPGVQDFLPEECYNKELVTSELLTEFSLWGYDRLENASLEYYDNFQTGKTAIDQRRMFKMTDTDGNLIVLCPDITLPLARLAVTKMDGTYPIKLCYSGNVFETGLTAKTRVQAQAGVEFMGLCGAEADQEVISLAVTALKRIGLSEFKIDIGQVNFFKGLMREYGLSEEQAEKIRLLVDKKNMLGVELMLKEIGADARANEAIKSLPSLFGGYEVIDKARILCNNKKSLEALNNLETVYRALEESGLSDFISIDLGMVQRISYYSGIVFRGLSKYIGAPILTGGRYDGLSESFGKELPATGFAVDVKKVLIALEYQNGLKVRPGVDVAVCSEGEEKFTFDYLSNLRASGKRVLRVYLPQDQLKKYCTCRNIANGIYIDKNNKAVIVYG